MHFTQTLSRYHITLNKLKVTFWALDSGYSKILTIFVANTWYF